VETDDESELDPRQQQRVQGTPPARCRWDTRPL
jgi:hypothetical protein